MKYLLAFLLSTSYCFGYDVLIPKRLESTVVNKYFKNVLSKVYSNIGIEIRPIYVTEEEINQRIKDNNYDALFSKISDEDIIEYSIPIQPPLIKHYKVYRWKLKNSAINKKRFSVGAIKGVIAHTKAIIKRRTMFSKVKYFSNYEEMVKAIYSKKIDSVLLSDEEYFNVFSTKLKSELERLPDPLISITLNHFINEKHKNISAKLTNEFKKWNDKKELSFTDFLKKEKALKGPSYIRL